MTDLAKLAQEIEVTQEMCIAGMDAWVNKFGSPYTRYAAIFRAMYALSAAAKGGERIDRRKKQRRYSLGDGSPFFSDRRSNQRRTVEPAAQRAEQRETAVPHGVCHADDPNGEAPGTASSQSQSQAAGADAIDRSARGVAPSVSDDSAGTPIQSVSLPTEPERLTMPAEPHHRSAYWHIEWEDYADALRTVCTRAIARVETFEREAELDTDLITAREDVKRLTRSNKHWQKRVQQLLEDVGGYSCQLKAADDYQAALLKRAESAEAALAERKGG